MNKINRLKGIWLLATVAVALLALMAAGCSKEEKAATPKPAEPTKAAAASPAATAPAATAAATTAAKPTPAPKAGPGMAPDEPFDYAAVLGTRKGTYYDLLRQYRAGTKPASTVQPKKGGIYVGVWPVAAPNMDIFGAGNSNSVQTSMIYNGLLSFDTGRGRHVEKVYPVPDIANKWDITADGRTYTFYLNPDAKWQNVAPVNGRAVTSKDVKSSLEAWAASPLNGQYFPIESINTPDDRTVVVRLTKTYAPFLGMLSWFSTHMVPPELLEKGTDGKQKIISTAIGSGAFMFESAEPAVKWVLKKNPDYWAKDKYGQTMPYFDKVVWLSLPDFAAQMAAFRTGQVDNSGFSPQTLGDMKALQKSVPDAYTEVAPGSCGSDGAFRLKLEQKPFDDVRVRRALSMAIDREGMWETLYEGAAGMDNIVPESWLGKSKTSDGFAAAPLSEWPEWYQYSPDKAKKLLADAGYPTGFKTVIEMTMVPTVVGLDPEAVTYVQANWKKIGVDLEIVTVPTSAEMNTKIVNRQWKELMLQISGGTFDPEVVLRGQYYSKSPTNRFGPRAGQDPDLDAIIDKQSVTLDPEERRKLWIQAVERIYDQVYSINLGTDTAIKMHQGWVEDVQDHGCAWVSGLGSRVLDRSWFNGKESSEVKNRKY